jgi:hypothetical protein
MEEKTPKVDMQVMRKRKEIDQKDPAKSIVRKKRERERKKKREKRYGNLTSKNNNNKEGCWIGE